MKKIALLSDIHGNANALEAVLKDIEDEGGVHAYTIEATYVILEAEQTHHSIKHRFVPYDRAKVIEKMKQVHCPSLRFVTRHLNGDFVKESWKMSV